MVAGQDKYIIRIVAVDKAQVLIYRICRALVPLSAALCLIRREYGHSALRTVKIPWAAVTYVFVQHERLILREHTDGVYPEFTQLDIGKSIILYLPPKLTAGFAVLSVSAYSLLP